MRVFIRNQINELIPTICEGIQYAKTAEQNEALMIYSDCLDAIRSVKISLESGLSKERYESYNEMVSVVESSIEGLKSGQDDGNKSVEGLIKIADNLTCEEEVKLEVVFFPYKSSMWDSMESVWRAANDDSNCNAYVVPIPYYDKNPDGTFGEYHYEGGDLPKDVPVIHYDIYNLEKHMPDIIYVHNPYDDYNRVTSVDPKFYSSELKKYTNMLVYIPYFATGNMQADTFGNLPFYRNVDYIITQSPKINGFFDKSLLNKLLPLGTPKFDNIINYKVDREEVLRNWNINNYDKVFFFNTSISSLLKYREYMILKIQYVLDVFEKLNYALIWRPHPLMKATIKSMLPQFLPHYETLLKRAELLPNIVVDESPDANTAIKISDAYIGEETSSVVHLFGVEGKPIFLTNPLLRKSYDSEKDNIKIKTVVEIEEEYWMVASYVNKLIKCNREGKILETYDIPNEKPLQINLFIEMLYVKNKLYLIPFLGQEIITFDLLTKQFEKIKFNNPANINFSAAHVYKDSIYMIPVWYDAILQLNIATNEIIYHKQIVDDMVRLKKDKNISNSFYGNLIEDNLLYIAMAGSNHVFTMDLDTNKYKYYSVGDSNDTYWCMAGKDGKFVLGTSNKAKLIIWDKLHTKEINIFPSGWQGNNDCFYKILCFGKDVIVIPKFSNMILKVNLETEEVCEEKLTLTKLVDLNTLFSINFGQYSMVESLNEEKIFLQDAFSDNIEIVNLNAENEKFSLILPQYDIIEKLKNSFGKVGDNIPWAVTETEICSLDKFVEYVSNFEHDSKAQKIAYSQTASNLDGSCGAKIHNTIKNKMV